MWLVDGFKKHLEKISAIEEIGEIILIDNTINPPDLDIPKVIHIKEYKNTFINPAWNKGVKLAKYNKICISSDDIDFDTKIFSAIFPHITNDKGFIGLYEFWGQGVWQDKLGGIKPDNDNYTSCPRDLPLLICPYGGGRRHGFACLFFFHQENWITIPDQLKIFCGDDYILDNSLKPNYGIINLDIWGKPSQTVFIPELKTVRDNDIVTYQKMTGQQ